MIKTIKNSTKIFAVISIAALTACASNAPYEVTNATPSNAQSISTTAYRLGAGDKVNVRVFGEEQLTGEFELDSNGGISFPLIGNIPAKDKTAREIESSIETALANGYIVDPKVSVEVLTYRPFYILGEVKQPGAYNYVTGISVSKAVALAGGYTYRAQEKYALVKRSDTPEQEVKVAPGATVYPGDVITINERYF